MLKALYEPHNIRPAYWRFLVKISDNKFAEVNRHLLDAFGVGSSTIDRQENLIKLAKI